MIVNSDADLTDVMRCSAPRISPRTVIGVLAATIVLGLGMINAVRAATGGPVPANWLGFTLMGCTSAIGFCAFLILYDRAYRVCWSDNELRVRLPGVTWRLRLNIDVVVPYDRMVLVSPEEGPVMPALRNVLVWYQISDSHDNVPLSPILLSRTDLTVILKTIAQRSGATFDDRLSALIEG